jgi:hypothetical protein
MQDVLLKKPDWSCKTGKIFPLTAVFPVHDDCRCYLRVFLVVFLAAGFAALLRGFAFILASSLELF